MCVSHSLFWTLELWRDVWLMLMPGRRKALSSLIDQCYLGGAEVDRPSQKSDYNSLVFFTALRHRALVHMAPPCTLMNTKAPYSYGSWSKVMHDIGDRVPFGTQTTYFTTYHYHNLACTVKETIHCLSAVCLCSHHVASITLDLSLHMASLMLLMAHKPRETALWWEQRQIALYTDADTGPNALLYSSGPVWE